MRGIGCSFSIEGHERPDSRVNLITNGGFLRWIVTDTGGREAEVSRAISAWSPGPHALVATWEDGRITLAVDGQPVAENEVGTLRLRAGDRIQVGSPSHPDTTVTSLVLTTTAATPSATD